MCVTPALDLASQRQPEPGEHGVHGDCCRSARRRPLERSSRRRAATISCSSSSVPMPSCCTPSATSRASSPTCGSIVSSVGQADDAVVNQRRAAPSVARLFRRRGHRIGVAIGSLAADREEPVADRLLRGLRVEQAQGVTIGSAGPSGSERGRRRIGSQPGPTSQRRQSYVSSGSRLCTTPLAIAAPRAVPDALPGPGPSSAGVPRAASSRSHSPGQKRAVRPCGRAAVPGDRGSTPRNRSDELMTTVANPRVKAVLRRAAVRATRAPSVHNTQPWRLHLAHGQLSLFADRSRQLRVLDPTSRQMTISCGCALLNARVAIAAEGLGTDVERFPDPDQPDLLARISVTDTPEHDAATFAALDHVIELRQTNRRHFTDDEVPAEIIDTLERAARHEGGRAVRRAPRGPPARRRAAEPEGRRDRESQPGLPRRTARLDQRRPAPPRRCAGARRPARRRWRRGRGPDPRLRHPRDGLAARRERRRRATNASS